MLGRAVVERATGLGLDVHAATRADLDVTDAEAVQRVLREVGPAAVVHCAAYTDVDGAESEWGLAEAVNARGAGNVASAAERVGARIVHVSTDYVFDGSKREPWVESDRSRAGRLRDRSSPASRWSPREPAPSIVRTGGRFCTARNFPTRCSRSARARKVSVVTDQVGCRRGPGTRMVTVELAEARGDRHPARRGRRAVLVGTSSPGNLRACRETAACCRDQRHSCGRPAAATASGAARGAIL